MPMYEYQCQDCGTRFERLSWNSEGASQNKVHCACGSDKAERIWFSRVAIATGHAAEADTGMDDSACGMDGGCCGGGACGMDAGGMDSGGTDWDS